MYSFHTHRNPDIAMMSYARLEQRSSGLITHQTIGSTIVHTESPRVESILLNELNTPMGHMIYERVLASMESSFDSHDECFEAPTDAENLDALVAKALSTWQNLVDGSEVVTVMTDLAQIQEQKIDVLNSGLAVATSQFAGYVASASEIDSLQRIYDNIPRPGVGAGDGPGHYL